MTDESNFTCIVRISDAYTDQSRGQIKRDVWGRLRFTGGSGNHDPELSVSGTYVGAIGQPKTRVGDVSGDLQGREAVEVLDELYRQATDGSEENDTFRHGSSIHFEPVRTAELESVFHELEIESCEPIRE